MKIPLRFQITEFDCGTVALQNAISYLFDRENVPAELIRAISIYTVNCYDERGNISESGVTRDVMENMTVWIDNFLREEDFLEINCLTPFETAANKFSAFLWRADCKDRTSDDKKFNDPAIIRHLYDLYKLKEVIKNNKSDFYGYSE